MKRVTDVFDWLLCDHCHSWWHDVCGGSTADEYEAEGLDWLCPPVWEEEKENQAEKEEASCRRLFHSSVIPPCVSSSHINICLRGGEDIASSQFQQQYRVSSPHHITTSNNTSSHASTHSLRIITSLHIITNLYFITFKPSSQSRPPPSSLPHSVSTMFTSITASPT